MRRAFSPIGEMVDSPNGRSPGAVRNVLCDVDGEDTG